MGAVDEMPRAFRDLINEFGWNSVTHFMGMGITNAVRLRTILESRRAEQMKKKGVGI